MIFFEYIFINSDKNYTVIFFTPFKSNYCLRHIGMTFQFVMRLTLLFFD